MLARMIEGGAGPKARRALRKLKFFSKMLRIKVTAYLLYKCDKKAAFDNVGKNHRTQPLVLFYLDMCCG